MQQEDQHQHQHQHQHHVSEQELNDLLQKRRDRQLETMKAKAQQQQKHNSEKKSMQNISEGEWINVERMMRVTKQRGKHIMTMGVMKKNYKKYGSAKWLFPEEALYLFDQGYLDVMHNGQKIESIANAYALFLSDDRQSDAKHVDRLDILIVYSYLKRLGFVVHRHECSSELISKTGKVESPGSKSKNKHKKQRNYAWFPKDIVRSDAQSRGWWDVHVDMQTNIAQLRKSGVRVKQRQSRKDLSKEEGSGSTVPLIGKLCLKEGDEIDMKQLYDILQIIGTGVKDSNLHGDEQFQSRASPLHIMFNLWKPGTNVSGKNPKSPLGSIIIVNPNDAVPSLSELDQLVKKSSSQDRSIYFAMVEDGGVTFTKHQFVELTNTE